MRRQLVVLAAFVIACSGDDSTPGPTALTDATHIGNYPLSTINGTGLPFTVATAGEDKFDVIAGTIVLNSDGSFADAMEWRETLGGQVSVGADTLRGTYTRNGTTVVFRVTSPMQGTYSVSFESNKLTEVMDGFTLVYQR